MNKKFKKFFKGIMGSEAKKIEESSEQNTMQSDSQKGTNSQEGTNGDAITEASGDEQNTADSCTLDSCSLGGEDAPGELNEAATEQQPSEQQLSPEQQRIAQLEVEVAELKDKYLRSLADFENFRKRAMKERSDLLKYQGDRIIYDILEVADNLERALASVESDPQSLKEGLPLIHKGLIDTLGKWEIKAESALGKPFDPVKHRALSSVPLHDTAPGLVINEFRKAYFYKDKVLRVGEVVTSATPPPPADPTHDEKEQDAE